MSVPTVCRVCLVSNLNLYGVRNDLQTAYVRITREKYNKVGYPLSMCYICLSALQKCHRFMETARDTNRMLKQWHNQQNEVTVFKPLSIYSVSKAEFISIEHENALDPDIKTEVDPGPDNCDTINISLDIEKTGKQRRTRLFIDSLCFEEELNDDGQTHILPNSDIDVEIKSELETNTNIRRNVERNKIISICDYDSKNTYVDRERTDRDEKRDASLSPNDSTYIDTVEDDDGRRTDPVSVDNVDIDSKSRLASGVPPAKKLARNKAKSQHHTPETSTEIGANSETSNNITPLNTSQTQLENMKQGKKQTKSAYVKCNRNKKETAKLNKIVKNKSIHNKKKKTRSTCKNIKNLNKLSVETTITEKTEIDKLNTIPLNTAVADCMLNADRNKQIDLYKYCEVCNMKCFTKDDLARHMRFHDNSRPHECDVCHYRFLQLHHLNSHKTLIHYIGTTKEYFCDICNHKSLQRSDLIKHIRIHSGNKPFTCNICSHKSRSKGNLKSHMRTHTGEKPFSCNFCSYKSALKSTLKLHMRTHTGEKPFSCNFCSYKSALKCTLKLHMTSHTGQKPFSCNFCSYKSALKSTLKLHMRTHTGEKPFSCNICSHKSSNNTDLKKHLLKHTGEKPFSCRICNYKCARKDNLKSHMRTHTKR